MRWILLMAGLLAGTAEADSLLDVYRLALRNDPTFRAARASLRSGLEEKKLGRAELLPKVNINAGYSQSLTQGRGQFPAGGLLIPNRTDRGIETKTWGVSLQQPIFDLSAWFRFRQGETLSEEAKAQFAAASQALILRVAEAYVAVLRSMANLAASRALETATERQLEQARERFEVGLVAVTDVREAESAHDLALAQRIGDEGALKVAKERLGVLTGQYHETLWTLRNDYPVVDPDPENPDHWVQFARAHNYDIKVAALAMAAALQQARAAAAGHLPKLSANLSYNENRSDVDFHNLSPSVATADGNRIPGGPRYEAFPSNSNQGSFSLNLSMPLFAGGALSATRRKAYAEYERASENHLGTVRTTVQGSRAEYINVMTHVARVRARRQAVASSRTSLEATRAGYEVGTRTIVDVLTAIQTFHAAVRDHANARLDYVLATLRLKRLAGILSPADLEELNRWLRPPKNPS